jgi:hypothetical protein
VERLKDQGKTACELFDHLKEAQAEVRALNLQLSASKDLAKMILKEFGEPLSADCLEGTWEDAAGRLAQQILR